MKTPEATFVTPSARSCDQTSTAIVTGWRYPGKVDSARAEVLALLLMGEELTSLDAWRKVGTSRLAADVHALRESGWPVQTMSAEARCTDGHLATVALYKMPRKTIIEVMLDGAEAWCRDVKEARAQKRAEALGRLQ